MGSARRRFTSSRRSSVRWMVRREPPSVRGHAERGAPAEGAGGREQSSQADAGRCDARQRALSATGPRTMASGTELTSTAILAWSECNKVAWHYIPPGKPTQNAFIERFASRPFGSMAACATVIVYDHLERDPVPWARPCPSGAGSLAAGLQ
jgi:hypothetical protein